MSDEDLSFDDLAAQLDSESSEPHSGWEPPSDESLPHFAHPQGYDEEYWNLEHAAPEKASFGASDGYDGEWLQTASQLGHIEPIPNRARGLVDEATWGRNAASAEGSPSRAPLFPSSFAPGVKPPIKPAFVTTSEGYALDPVPPPPSFAPTRVPSASTSRSAVTNWGSSFSAAPARGGRISSSSGRVQPENGSVGSTTSSGSQYYGQQPSEFQSASNAIPSLGKVEEDYFEDEDPAFEEALGKMCTPTPTTLERASTSRTIITAPRDTSGKGVKLRQVNLLPDVYRSLWRFGVFNAVQSICFEAPTFMLSMSRSDGGGRIYESDQNVVVSAPTGAGKTVLFELAIIRLLSTAIDDVKVVYLAPTKALCNERTRDWQQKFSKLHLSWGVLELTGDSEHGLSSLSAVGNNKLIITTAEKWDSLTRRWHSHSKTLAKIKLICIDEVHSVGMDTRGAVLEVIVSRMKALSESIRFVALSATAPNIGDVGEWLGGTEVSAKIFTFGPEYRPCQLQKVVVAFPSFGNDFTFSSSLNAKLFDLIKKHSSGKPVIVFSSTRKGCVDAAKALVKEYEEHAAKKSSLPWPRPSRRQGAAPNDKLLATFLHSGVAYHHAGLDTAEKRMVEDAFLNGSISIICTSEHTQLKIWLISCMTGCTSTLSVGVNLPARMVIIKGTKQYAAPRFVEYSDVDVLQMIGRAGRPQFDKSGVAVILTDSANKHRYEALAQSETTLESTLQHSLVEHVNSEVTLQTITSIDSAVSWLRSTFLYVRIKKNPSHYSLQSGGSMAPEARLQQILLEALDKLSASGVIDRNDSDLKPTQYGDIMSKYYIGHESFLKLKELPPKSSMKVLLDTLSASIDGDLARIRSGEKGLLPKLGKNLRFPVSKVTSPADKIMILIQLVLEAYPLAELKTDNSNPAGDILAIWPHASRICKCMIDLALENCDGGVNTILKLIRSINGRAWDDNGFVLRQLTGVGEKTVKAFADKGILSLGDIRSSEPQRLELICNRNPPFGKSLIRQANTFPRFHVNCTAVSEKVTDVGIHIVLDIGLDIAKTPEPILKKGAVKLWASVTVTTSDQEYIEFRRIRISQLVESPKDFRVSVCLVKPSQRIIVSASCDDLEAGTEVKEVFKPSIAGSSYPVPAVGQKRDEDMPEDDDGIFAEPPTSHTGKVQMAEPLVETLPERTKVPYKRKAPVELEIEPAETLPNEDRSSCRHMCCRDGLEKIPAKKVAKQRIDEKDQLDDIAASVSRKPSVILKQTLLPPAVSKPRPKAVPAIPKKGKPSKPQAMQSYSFQTEILDSDSDAEDLFISKAKTSVVPQTRKQDISHPDEDEVDELDSDDEIDDLPAPPHPKLPLAKSINTRVTTQNSSKAKLNTKSDLFLPTRSSPSLTGDIPPCPPSIDEGISRYQSRQLEITPGTPGQVRSPSLEVEEQAPTAGHAAIEHNGKEEDGEFEDWLKDNVIVTDE